MPRNINKTKKPGHILIRQKIPKCKNITLF